MIIAIVIMFILVLGLLVYVGKRRIAYDKQELEHWRSQRKLARMKWHELEFERIMVAIDLLGIKQPFEWQTKEREEMRHKYSQVVEQQKIWQ